MAIIIDTDPGHDDALAIMLALKSGLEVRAVTTVAGNAPIERTTTNARFILGLLHSEVPVYSGATKPLVRELRTAVVHGKSGLDGLDPTNPPGLTGDAAERIIELVKREEITIIALGPLTNIAAAIRKDPATMRRVKELRIMGGAVRVPGNMSPVAEFNIFVDPDAAKIVFDFPIKKVLVPLDACNHVQLQLNDFERIKGPLRDPVLKMMRPYIENTAAHQGVHAALMYDPLTVFSLLDQSYVSEELAIKVETSDELRGKTVETSGEPNTTVIFHFSAERFTAALIDALSRPNLY